MKFKNKKYAAHKNHETLNKKIKIKIKKRQRVFGEARPDLLFLYLFFLIFYIF
jgi:hypothetical protein